MQEYPKPLLIALRNSNNVQDLRVQQQIIFSIQSVKVGSLCDNFEVDYQTGDVWLGCHPNGEKLGKYDPTDPPGSEVSACFLVPGLNRFELATHCLSEYRAL